MRLASVVVSGLTLLTCFAGESWKQPSYKVLPAIGQGNLTIFPVVADKTFDTSQFLTLDEGIRSGQVIVTEAGQTAGLVRPRPYDDGVWHERPFPIPQGGARVNQLTLINGSDRPLLLLAGEIVTGGKQDRVVGRDRIIPARSEPVALDVFCVEPHRWMGISAQFEGTASAMAQPSVRSKAMAERISREYGTKWPNQEWPSQRAFRLFKRSRSSQALPMPSPWKAAESRGNWIRLPRLLTALMRS